MDQYILQHGNWALCALSGPELGKLKIQVPGETEQRPLESAYEARLAVVSDENKWQLEELEDALCQGQFQFPPIFDCNLTVLDGSNRATAAFGLMRRGVQVELEVLIEGGDPEMEVWQV
jgi:hypothetical protein